MLASLELMHQRSRAKAAGRQDEIGGVVGPHWPPRTLRRPVRRAGFGRLWHCCDSFLTRIPRFPPALGQITSFPRSLQYTPAPPLIAGVATGKQSKRVPADQCGQSPPRWTSISPARKFPSSTSSVPPGVWISPVPGIHDPHVGYPEGSIFADLGPHLNGCVVGRQNLHA